MQSDALMPTEKMETFFIKKEDKEKIRDYITSQEDQGWKLVHERLWYNLLGLHIEMKFVYHGVAF